ncbi:MAG: MarR family transcriptional regulator [Marmoricola sp.]|nr:MarR family transcriptional regulator [Marmoricola sp.]
MSVSVIAPARSSTASEHRLRLERSGEWYLSTVSSETGRGADSGDPQWLSEDELQSWLSLVRLITWLPWSIDQQLQKASNLGMVEYQVLAMLSESPELTLRMSSLADVTNASLSRLSHLVKRLESRGYVRREPDATDGRFTNAILTESGAAVLEAAAPDHVRHVRTVVVDALSPEQFRRLGRDAERIMARIDTSTIN